MRPDLLLLALREQRGAFFGWAASWLLLVSVYVASWPAVRDNGEKYDEILSDLPVAMRKMLGSAAASGVFSTAEGYFTVELLSVTGPALVVIMALLRGTKLVAHEEETGPLETLLAQPVSRTRVLLERGAAAALELVAVLACAGAGLLAIGSLVDVGLSVTQVLRAFSVLALLALEALALGVFFGALLGRVGRSRAVGGGVLLVAFLLHAVGSSIPGVSWAVPLSPFHTVVASDPFRHGVAAGALLALTIPTCALMTASVAAFRRRDVHLP